MVRPCERKTEEDIVMRTWKWMDTKEIGSPKLRWSDVISKGMKEKQR